MSTLREAVALVRKAHEAVGQGQACTLDCRPESDPEDVLCPACVAFVALEAALPVLETFASHVGDVLQGLQDDVG